MGSAHILSTFESALSEFRDNALMMASLTQRNFEHARQGLFERDEDWSNTVIADDEEVDTLEMQLDRQGIDLMVRFHPVASDLRTVVSTMKFSVNLERIADQCVNIARRSRKLTGRTPVDELKELEAQYRFTGLMLDDAIRAFADSNVELARTLRERDRTLDIMNRDFAEKLTSLMPEKPENIPSYMDLIFTARFLERIGDQAKNIGDDVIYAVSAEESRHPRRGGD